MVVGDGRTKKVMVVLWCPARIREVVVADEQDLGAWLLDGGQVVQGQGVEADETVVVFDCRCCGRNTTRAWRRARRSWRAWWRGMVGHSVALRAQWSALLGSRGAVAGWSGVVAGYGSVVARSGGGVAAMAI